jgi:molybdopterin-guanine dinucleotide biosynthesis protein A
MNQVIGVTGLILAGGRGSRVGGQDKGLLLWRGKALTSHVIDRLRGQTNELIISCNRNRPAYQSLGVRTIVDQREDFQGPLAGIEASREFVATRFLAVAACDTPMLPLDLVPRLLTPLLEKTKTGPVISIAHDGTRQQYLCAVFDVACLDSLSTFLAQGHRAVKHWYQQTPHVVVDFSDQAESFRNHNDLDSFSEQ